VGEDVLLGARVRGIVANHEEIEYRILDELPGPRPVMDRDSQEANLSLLPQLLQLFLHGAREEGHFPQPVELEHIEIFDAQQAERRNGRPAQRPRGVPEKRAGADHVTFPVAGDSRAERDGKPFIRGLQKTYWTCSRASRHPASSRSKLPESPNRNTRRASPGISRKENSLTPTPFRKHHLLRAGDPLHSTSSSPSAGTCRSTCLFGGNRDGAEIVSAGNPRVRMPRFQSGRSPGDLSLFSGPAIKV